MKKIILAACVIISMFASCGKPNYMCTCYLNGVNDTNIYMGKISAGEANKNCEVVNSLRPADSCYAMQEAYK
ncbi:hypothetical protein CJD36_009320 [Flavipsychrobacter stenotrophus]|uniref:Uncharacterized protein n=1 Tax=Flavipsychrobacter stenotrophus TaxID=2077091 RepID=A0A2S7SYF6_9BACT|nr:hypothetical protein [Flavipsychrobacter stenotrophus]PQJ11980.1 hypothetical protein CJD36_009320 [Flavipsychrobacter stenotrophus]